MSWKNYGDENPIEHGGIFVREDEDGFPNAYYMVRINQSQDEDESWFLDDMYFDLNNIEWVEWEKVNNYSDINNTSDDINKIIALASFYGSQEFGHTETFHKKEELIHTLKENYHIEL